MPKSEQILVDVKLVEEKYLARMYDDMPGFARKCKDEFKKKPVSKFMTLQAYQPPFFQLNPEKLSGLDKLSFKIEEKQIIQLASALLNIVRDPFLLADNLKDLDVVLGQKMQEAGILFHTDEPGFNYLIAGKGHYIPGPPSVHYKPKKRP